MSIPRLGVNIDHVATLRQQRDEGYPLIERAAEISLSSGADQITIHLREDRRHIQDDDLGKVKSVTDKFNKPLNLEIGSNPEIIEKAIQLSPAWICLVPENREEKTTEGGLNLIDDQILSKIKTTCETIKEKTSNTKLSLFIESNPEILKRACSLKIDAVEIHTGEYAKDFLEGQDWSAHLESYHSAAVFLKEKGVACHAGHGLTNKSVIPLLESKLFEEYNIGHWIISEAVYEGLDTVVKNLKSDMERYQL